MLRFLLNVSYLKYVRVRTGRGEKEERKEGKQPERRKGLDGITVRREVVRSPVITSD